MRAISTPDTPSLPPALYIPNGAHTDYYNDSSP